MNDRPEMQKLLAEIEQFLEDNDMLASTLGHRVVKDGKLVDRLRRGRTVTLDTAAAIRAFMRNPEKFIRARARQKKALERCLDNAA